MSTQSIIHKVRTWVLAIVFAMAAGGPLLGVASAPVSLAKQACGDTYFLTIPAWYNGLTTSDKAGNCIIASPGAGQTAISNFVWHIVLNVIAIILNLAGYLAAGYIIYGGFKYILATGAPDAVTKAKTTITNAVIGLVLSIMAVAIVNVIQGAF